jgi:hypothetical protein
MKRKINIFISADRSHILIAEWKHHNGEISRYRKADSDENMSREDYEKKLMKYKTDGFYINLEADEI